MEPRTTLLGGESSARTSSPGASELAAAAPATPRTRKVTVPAIRRMKEDGERIVMVTAYDTPTARIVDRAGAEIILVGDSLGMVVLGYESTLQVDMVDMLRHTGAVARAHPKALIVGDMPFLSYQVSSERAVLNAGRFIRQAGADAVKLEGGRAMLPVVEAIVRAAIPVIGHIGLTPQSVKRFGGYRVQGRGADASEALLEDALALEAAGVFAIVLEGIPRQVGRSITQAVGVPTIGIGAGPDTDGQVLVLHDLIGLNEGRAPRFVKRYADVGAAIQAAVQQFADEVRSGAYPEDGHCYD